MPPTRPADPGDPGDPGDPAMHRDGSAPPAALGSGILGRAETEAFEAGRLRLQTLVLLRWLAVAGQAGAVLFTHFVLGFDLPLGLCLGAVAASAWLNILLTIRYPAPRRLGEAEAAVYLAYDIVQLAVLLYLTGGLENPFAILVLVPVTISATTLSLRATLGLATLAFVAVTLLGPFHRPLPWFGGEEARLPALWLVGMWTALVLGLAFMTAYAFRVAGESRRMAAALSATQAVLAREQRLSALDGLAAAAAHELGTPLATISLVAKELTRDAPPDSDFADDVKLLHSQAERCRQILAALSRRGEAEDAMHARMALPVLLEEAVAPFRGGGPQIAIELAPDRGAKAGEPPELSRRIEILYALRNLIENAVGFARSRVIVRARWTADDLEIAILDDGPGFGPEVIDELGEPYVSGRARHDGTRRGQAEGGGLGLGFFIAKTLLERTGARLIAANRGRAGAGAVVRIVWPRRLIEAHG